MTHVSANQQLAGLVPVIDVDVLEQEPLPQSPASPTGAGTGINARQANRFKRFSAILSVS
jgi:hypothetical protein